MPDNSSTQNSNKISLNGQKNDDKMKHFGISFYAVMHSHVYWVFSIIYIAYHQMTPHKSSLSGSTRWKYPDGILKKKSKHSHQRHCKKKSLTHKPKTIIMPSTKPKAAIIALTTKVSHANNAKEAISQQKIPLLHALRTFPSSSSKHPLNIHQLIRSQRKIPKRNNSTGHIQTSNVILPPSLVNSEEDTSSDESSIQIQSISMSKKNRAIGLLRSTFHRSNSTGQLKQRLNSSFSSLSEDEGVVIDAKKRKRDTIFGITRKFSSRKNVPAIATTATTKTTTTTTTDDDQQIVSSVETDTKKSLNRTKLFRNLSSWKRDK
ncbi:hypothetical protein INT46_002963 [Mucor plumbeus]|uniref:Uncharacterized protein n=1 Tax=Mucor plumbeus TaxID=97098 RepID=A0A8H7QGS7_9FUNG|nr:hypothetical protein INT46_002963 [Mucor plumbeus]